MVFYKSEIIKPDSRMVLRSSIARLSLISSGFSACLSKKGVSRVVQSDVPVPVFARCLERDSHLPGKRYCFEV
jgi:hypothetical protein